MAETLQSLKRQVTKLKNENAKLKKEGEGSKEAAGYMPRALEILDNLTIAAEGDGSALEGAAGAAREFLDTLPKGLQTSFRDWHPNVRVE